MPFCKTCGTFYPKSLGVCPKCNADEILLERREAVAPKEMKEEDAGMLGRRSWLQLLIGVPALILFLYGMFYMISRLS